MKRTCMVWYGVKVEYGVLIVWSMLVLAPSIVVYVINVLGNLIIIANGSIIALVGNIDISSYHIISLGGLIGSFPVIRWQELSSLLCCYYICIIIDGRLLVHPLMTSHDMI
jgi:hypothetical protein